MAKTRKKPKRKSRTLDKPSQKLPAQIYWPEHLDQVKAIALQGLNDKELARALGVSDALLDSWLAYYPEMAAAIAEGRTEADAQVVAALHKNAVGFHYKTDEVVRTRHGADVVRVRRYIPGETQAQKFWLANRDPAHWNRAALTLQGGPKDKPIHVSNETKALVINSILNLIRPQPDS